MTRFITHQLIDLISSDINESFLFLRGLNCSSGVRTSPSHLLLLEGRHDFETWIIYGSRSLFRFVDRYDFVSIFLPDVGVIKHSN